MLIDGVRGILTDAGVGDNTVQEILAMLDDAQSKVKKGEDIQAVPAAALGGAPTAAELQLHAGKAHDHVVEAMTQMVNGLQGYYDSVKHFRQDVHDTDAGEATRYAQRTQATEQVEVTALLEMGAACTQPENFHDAPRCEVPTDGGEQ